MTDIASLGIRIDSSQAKPAIADLDKLAASAKLAGDATDKLAAATGKSQTQIRAIQSMADRAQVSFGTMNARVDAASAGHAKFAASATTATQSVSNLANAAAGSGGSGGNGGSLVNAADKSNSALDRLANTLTRRVLFAAVANEVRQFAQYVWNLNSAIAATADAAQRSSIGGGQFQGLQTSAAYKGVSNTDFNGAMVAFNQQVDLAKHGVGDLKILFAANGKTVGDTATNFGIVADMVSRAGSEAQKLSILQQAGLPANAAFAKYMEQGAASINAQAAGTIKLTQQQLDDAVRINEKWQTGWVNFESWGKKAVVNVFEFMGNTWTSVPAWFKGQADSLYAVPKPNAQGKDWLGVGAPRGVVTSAPLPDVAASTRNPGDLLKINAQAQPRLGALGQLQTKPSDSKSARPEDSNDKEQSDVRADRRQAA
jgi:hypothetical protein